MKEITFYEVRHGNGVMVGKNGEHHFPSRGAAIDAATEFKNYPRGHNLQMSEESVEYWKKQTFTIVKKTITTLELDVI